MNDCYPRVARFCPAGAPPPLSEEVLPPLRPADGVARDAACHTRRERTGFVDAAHCAARTSARLDYPLGDGRNREITDNADDKEDDIDASALFGDIGRVLQRGDVRFEHQGLYLRQHGGKQVGDRQPQVDADVTGYPTRERSVEPVVHGEGERQRPQNREHDQKECSKRVDRKTRGIEQQLEKVAHQLPKPHLHVVPRSLAPHADDLAQVRDAELGEFLVVGFVVHQPRLALAHPCFVFQIVFLLLVCPQIHRLPLQDGVRALHHGRHDGVDRPQYDGREEHDAQTNGKRPQEREHVDRFGIGEGFPHAVGDVEQRPQTGYAFRHADHIAAHGHHLHIEIPQHLMQIVEIHC